MQEHNWVLNFFKSKLVSIEQNVMPLYSESAQNRDYRQFKDELNGFITNLRSHFVEEEQIVFPLAYKRNGKRESRKSFTFERRLMNNNTNDSARPNS